MRRLIGKRSVFWKSTPKDLLLHYLGGMVHCNGRLTIRKRSLFTNFFSYKRPFDTSRVDFWRSDARYSTGNVASVSVKKDKFTKPIT